MAADGLVGRGGRRGPDGARHAGAGAGGGAAQIIATDALETGGMFVASSSEINPPIPAENYQAMVDAVGAVRNPRFYPA